MLITLPWRPSILYVIEPTVACKRFTPLLRTIYEKLRAKQATPAGSTMDDFEFVYCSLDNYTAEYRSYTSQMPWWCLPHQSPVLDKLRTLYKAEGIPYMCVVDKEGDLLCGDAVNEAMEDPEGARFPWRCAQHLEEILPDTYVKNDGSYNPTADLDGKYLMLYFSARWCNRSTIFTRKLVRGYRALKRTRDDFEVSTTVRSIPGCYELSDQCQCSHIVSAILYTYCSVSL